MGKKDKLSVAQSNAISHTNHWGLGNLRSTAATRPKREIDSGSRLPSSL